MTTTDQTCTRCGATLMGMEKRGDVCNEGLSKPRVTTLLEALQHGDRLLTAVESLVRASRRMLGAFHAGDVEQFSSRQMEEALAPFAEWSPHVEVRGW